MGQGQESGGGAQRVSVVDCGTQPPGCNRESNKAARPSLDSVNHCARGNKCVFDKKKKRERETEEYMVSVSGPEVTYKRRSVSRI